MSRHSKKPVKKEHSNVLPEYLFSEISGAKYFSKLDAKS